MPDSMIGAARRRRDIQNKIDKQGHTPELDERLRAASNDYKAAWQENAGPGMAEKYDDLHRQVGSNGRLQYDKYTDISPETQARILAKAGRQNIGAPSGFDDTAMRILQRQVSFGDEEPAGLNDSKNKKAEPLTGTRAQFQGELSEDAQKRVNQLTGDDGWGFTKNGYIDQSSVIPTYDYDEEYQRLSDEVANELEEGDEAVDFFDEMSRNLKQIRKETPGQFINIGDGNRVQRGDLRDAFGNITLDPTQTVFTGDDDEEKAEPTSPRDMVWRPREDAVEKNTIIPALSEGLQWLAGWSRNARDLFSDWWNSGKDYKVKDAEGREIDESDLLEALPQYMEDTDNQRNGKRELVFTDPTTGEEIGREDVTRFGDDNTVMNLISSSPITYNDAEGYASIGDTGIRVPSYINQYGLVDMKPSSWRVDWSPGNLTLKDGTELTWDQLQELSDHANDEGRRYSASNSHALSNVPILGDLLDQVAKENYEITDDEGRLDLGKVGQNIIPWMADMVGYTLPYMIPGFNYALTASDIETASKGLDPYSYDPVSGTFADPGVQSYGDYLGNLTATGIESLGEYMLGLGGNAIGKGVRKALNRTPEQAAEHELKAATRSPVGGTLVNTGKIAGQEGAEEIIQTVGEELAHQMDSDAAGMFANDVGVDAEGKPQVDAQGNPLGDPNTPFEDRMANAGSDILQSFLGGATLGGLMGMPRAAREHAQRRRNFERNGLSWDEDSARRGDRLTDEDLQAIEQALLESEGE